MGSVQRVYQGWIVGERRIPAPIVQRSARSSEKRRHVASATIPQTPIPATDRAATGSPTSPAISAKAPSLADQWRA